MKKLNRRGYLTIEIVLAATLAFTIAFFLIDLTIKFANKTDDIQLDTLYITDNALLIENIREVINIDKDAGEITSIECDNEENKCTFTFDEGKQSTLKIDNDNKEVLYTGLKEGNNYTKKVSDNLTLKEISVGGKTEGFLQENQPYQIITIKARDIFVDKNYDINILIKKTQ